MKASAINPIAKAWDRMVLVLFHPFQFRKWLPFALAVFLWSLGISMSESLSLFYQLVSPPVAFKSYTYSTTTTAPTTQFSGSSSNITVNAYSSSSAISTTWRRHSGYASISSSSQFVLILGVALLSSVMLWFNARGSFLFMDQLARNNGQVAEAWNQTASPANNFAAFRILFLAISFVILGEIVGFATAVDLFDFQSLHSGGITLPDKKFLLMLLFLGVVAHFVLLVMDGILAPAMYARRMPVIKVWPQLWTRILRPHWQAIIAFYLVSSLISLIILLVVVVVSFLSCCCLFMPFFDLIVTLPFRFLQALMLLPLLAFLRLYGMYFVDQFGGDWIVFPDLDRTCPVCNYSLRGLPGAHQCPECGAVIDFQFPPSHGP